MDHPLSVKTLGKTILWWKYGEKRQWHQNEAKLIKCKCGTQIFAAKRNGMERNGTENWIFRSQFSLNVYFTIWIDNSHFICENEIHNWHVSFASQTFLSWVWRDLNFEWQTKTNQNHWFHLSSKYSERENYYLCKWELKGVYTKCEGVHGLIESNSEYLIHMWLVHYFLSM